MKGRIRIDMVVPDYYARFPKACMGGWGRQLMPTTPPAAPCLATPQAIRGMIFDSVRNHPLGWIWSAPPP